jgi:hypothetical protein
MLNERLSTTHVNWALTGSTSFALQGLPFEPSDIDIQTDEQGAYAIEQLFRDHVQEKVRFSSNGSIRSHFGELQINGIRVEIMGNIEKRIHHKWEKQPNLDDIKRFVMIDDIRIPVLSLEYEEKAYRALGRIEKADLIAQYLAAKND